LRGDQDVNLLEKALEAFFEFFEEPFGLPVSASDDFYLDDIVNKVDATVFPTSLIRGGLRTYGERTETAINSSRICLIFSASISVPSLYFNGR
jgi:hypothetical protein